MNPKVDVFFTAGCGRCALTNTPQCKVNDWQDELAALRAIILDCGLTEELKWGIPVYTFQKSNVVLISALKDYCVIGFFKGALLNDPAGILIRQTANMQAARQVRFTDVRQIFAVEDVLKTYIREAVEAEKNGLKVTYKKTAEFAVPEEFQVKLNEAAALKKAFAALTPGRQRAYLLYFAAPKKSETRRARIERYAAQILAGKGLND